MIWVHVARCFFFICKLALFSLLLNLRFLVSVQTWHTHKTTITLVEFYLYFFTHLCSNQQIHLIWYLFTQFDWYQHYFDLSGIYLNLNFLTTLNKFKNIESFYLSIKQEVWLQNPISMEIHMELEINRVNAKNDKVLPLICLLSRPTFISFYNIVIWYWSLASLYFLHILEGV